MALSYPQPVLCFDDGAAEDGGLCIVGDVDDLGDVLTRGRRDGLAHLLYEVFGVVISRAIGEEAMLSVDAVLRCDRTR